MDVSLIDDSVETLAELLVDRLAGGGCAGVVCDTVGRAQEVERALAARFGDKAVMLDHSRFIDIDRMENERVLRDLLGPQATITNGKRPGLLIVVGTQVLEQSLDIDFDLLITDIAPIDLVLQRLGRTHRHHRGEGECDRPTLLRTATCYVRGIASFGDKGPEFARGLTRVYDYFTAVDDCSAEDNAGAAMLDTIGFNSSTLYRYATVCLPSLEEQLGDAKAAAQGARAFLKAFVESMPTGKQNTFANRTLPSAVLVALRNDQPINGVSAFESPVAPKEDVSISHQAEDRLATKLLQFTETYGNAPAKVWWTAVDGGTDSLKQIGEQVTFPKMLDEVSASVLDALSKGEK